MLKEKEEMKRPALILLILFSALVFSTSCKQEEVEVKNLEQIYKEEGVPVKIEKIIPQEFKLELSLHSALTGIQESAAFASYADEVEELMVKVGDYVKKDDVLLTFPTDNPATRYYQAKIAFENAQKTYERVKNLFNDGGISQQELDNAGAAFEVSKADWEAVQLTVKARAPITGYVTKVNVREGDNVKYDDELFVISRIDRMKAKIWVSEKEILEIKKGQAAQILWQDAAVNGKIVQVDLAMDQDKQAFQAVIELENPGRVLKPGTTVEVRITTYTKPEAIVVKQHNVLKDGDTFFVYVLINGTAQKKTVILGSRQNLDVEVLEGLSLDDEMIIEGQMLLEQGTKVKVID
jgi:RND family efflux transporter MFP subunit